MCRSFTFIAAANFSRKTPMTALYTTSDIVFRSNVMRVHHRVDECLSSLQSCAMAEKRCILPLVLRCLSFACARLLRRQMTLLAAGLLLLFPRLVTSLKLFAINTEEEAIKEPH
ncbi:hypothetical protein TRVL_08629 [Trypanosoma vivax]|nr:hypothetical protein TRVL_08629 [Trypanosoma vivax]